MRQLYEIRMKIYFHLSGRLGNQLFQWAYLHELSNRGYSIELFIDKYHNDLKEPIYLNDLIEHCSHLPKIRVRNDLGLLLKISEKIGNKNSKLHRLNRILPILIEGTLDKKKRLPVIVDGFFIDKNWPEKYHDTLLSEFESLLGKRLRALGKWTDMIKLPNSTVIHVRRGDLRFHKNSFGLLSREYYLKNILTASINIILTDSFEDSRKMFSNKPSCHVVNPTEIDVWSALTLMAESQRLIMSNSTLSWWGGYLAKARNNAEILMPTPFYRQRSKFDELLSVEDFHRISANFE